MTIGDNAVERRRGLGRGLGALIPPVATERRAGAHDVYFTPATGQASAAADPMLSAVAGLTLRDLPLDAIRPNARQPRQVFDPDDLAELAFSLREVGVLQPVVVRPMPQEADAFELVVGERRWRAAREAGLERIPALVRETSDEAMLRDALLENLHRAQLNPLEEAAAYAQLLDEFGCTQDELAERIGRSRPQISNTIRLLRLPPIVQRRVAAGVLSAGHARALLALTDPLEQETLAQRVVAEGLSVRTVEELVSGAVDKPRKRRSATSVEVPEHVSDAATRLADRLDTRVTVGMGRTKGRLTIEFASTEDFDRIVSALLPA
jgi:ParB family transcriptional regulator, chromosome partitioning protein